MSKKQTIYVCDVCGYRSNKWLGKCPSCGAWNSFREVTEEKKEKKIHSHSSTVAPQPISRVDIQHQERTKTGFDEFDRVIGGGIVTGGVTLIGGQPGIGKSTLLLQIASNIAKKGLKILYVSGEESVSQIKMRAERLKAINDNILLLSETVFEEIEKNTEQIKPDMVILDSVQTLFVKEVGSVPGSVVQVREVAYRSTQIAKKHNIPFFLIGHVTKVGNIAGPSLLEHIVDTVLYFEGDKTTDLRILRGTKNRFGPTNEIGVFEMREEGLVEVKNPSALFLEGRNLNVPGTVVTVAMEGTRPFLVEIQALVSPSPFGVPRRTILGLDPNRVSLLIAVIEKRAGFHIGGQDIFVNVVGGIKLQETASDLAVVSAIVSSFKEEPVPSDMVLLGEIGLVGELRGIKDVEKRIKEAIKSDFTKIVIPEKNLTDVGGYKKNVLGAKNIKEALEIIFTS